MARPRAATFERSRAAILAAAARLFARHGYPVATIADVAAACGVSKALLYHYYRDKEELLFDIADRYVDSLLAIVAEVERDTADPAARLRLLIGRFVAAYGDAAAYHRVLVQDVKYLSAAHRARVNAKQRRVVQAFADAIAAAAPQLAGDALLKPVTMTLFGMINWTFTWLKPGGPVSHADLAPVVTALFLEGVGAVAPLGAARRSSRAPRGRPAARPRVAAPSPSPATELRTRNPA